MLLLTFGITCFNKEKTIFDCINSCLEIKKIFDSKIEIIVVDDSSKDKSLEKINSHFKKEIEIIELRNNKGVSNARNIIIERSNAKYLTFVDADDEINFNGFLAFINFLKDKDGKSYELIFGNYSNLNTLNNRLNKIINYTKKSIIKKSCVINSIKDYLIKPNKVNLYVQCFAKIFSTKYLKNNQIVFNKRLQNFEDVEFLAKCLKYSDSLIGVDYDLYTHKIYQPGNSETYSSTRSIKTHLGFLTAIDIMAEALVALIQKESTKSRNFFKKIDINFLKNQAKGSYICITAVMQAFRIKNIYDLFKFSTQLKQAFASREIKLIMKSYNSKFSGGSKFLAFSIRYNLWLIVAIISFLKFRKRYQFN